MYIEQREREGPLFFKALKLISPEKARLLGVIAEGPIFVSPYIGRPEVCKKCETQYGPLVYQAQTIVTAHHVCQEGGGIYHYSTGIMVEGDWRYKDGWVANIRPIGAQAYRSAFEQVFVKSIAAFCIIEGHNTERLTEGVIVDVEKEVQQGRLFPCCDADLLGRIDPTNTVIGERLEYDIRSRFRFRVTEDGRVVFGNI